MAGIVKRSITIAGHRTSISLEEPFWNALKDVAAERGQSVSALVREIDAARIEARSAMGLSGNIRVFLLDHYRRKAGGTA